MSRPAGRYAGCVRALRLLLFATAVLLAGCSPRLERHEYRRLVMGVEAHLTIYAPDESRAERAARRAFDRMAEVEQAMSDYRASSEVSRISDVSGRDWSVAGADLRSVLATAARVSEASGGAFDVTVGPAVGAWRTARRTGRLPGPDELARLRALIDWRAVEVDDARGVARLTRPAMRLDLGGIAKGYGAAEGLHAMRAEGVDRAMVALAGDIALGDPPPDAAGWRVEVSPGPGLPPSGVLTLRRVNVSTSGDAEQFIEIGGVRYAHIVDPRTALGVTGRMAATVIEEDPAACDALATAACVMEPEAAAAMLTRFPRACAILQRIEAGEVKVTRLGPERGRAPAWHPLPGR